MINKQPQYDETFKKNIVALHLNRKPKLSFPRNTEYR